MKIILYRGPSGAGKSTHANKVIDYCRNNNLSYQYCSADDFFVNETGDYKYSHHKICHAHTYCFDSFMSACGSKEDIIIVDNTNITLWEVMPYLQVAHYYDAPVHLLEFDAPWRVRMHNQKHNIPEEKIKAQAMIDLPGHILKHYVDTVTKCFDYNIAEAKAWAVGYNDTQHLGKYVWLGKVGLTIDSTDCDHCQSITHRVLDLRAYPNYVDNVYNAAEGPTHLSHYHPLDHDLAEEYKKDHLAEAHENGHPHYVSL